MLTRRAFIRSTAALAAGAAVGVTAFRGIRRHGPVEIRTYLFSEDPIVVQGELSSDESRDLFRVHVLNEEGKETCIAQMPLSGVRMAVESRTNSRQKVICLCLEEKRMARLPLAVVVEGDKVTFLVEEPKGDPTPVWMDLADVRRVL